MNVNRKSEIFLTSLLNHWNVTCTQLPAGIPDAVQIRALGIIASVVDDVAQAVADRFAGLNVHVCVLPRYRVVPRVRSTVCADIPHGHVTVLEHENTIGEIICSIV